MATNKVLATVAGVLGLAAAGWLGSAVLMGQQVESRLLAWKDSPLGPGGGLRITRMAHDRGLLSSTGRAEVVFEPGCAAAPGAEQLVGLRVDYQVTHTLMPGSLVQFSWQATPLGNTAEAMKAVFGSLSPLAGSGTLGLDGAVRTDMALPQLSLRRSGEAVTVSPSKGFLSVNGPAIHFGWQVDRIDVRGDGQAIAATDIALKLDLKNRHRGTGNASLTAGQLSLDAGTLDGLSLTSDVHEQGDRLDMRIVPAVRRVQAGGQELNSVSMALTVNGLDTHSVETLSQLFEASCGFKSMTANEGRQARDAALQLLARGLSLGISQVSGKSADGGVDGQLMVELAPGSGGQPSLARQLKANGHAQVTGNLLPANARQTLLAMGMATEHGAGLRAAFDYANGQLRLNDRNQDAAPLLAGLKAFDGQLQGLLARWGQAQATVAQAQAEAPAPDEKAADVAAESPTQASDQLSNTGSSVVATAALPGAVAGAQAAVPAVSDAAQRTRPVAVQPVVGEPPAVASAAAPLAAPGPTIAPSTGTGTGTGSGTSTGTSTSTSTSADCRTAAACVAQTLAAARRADISTVRQVATAFDTLAKPAPGNRPVSRQFNTTGLEALKHDDLPVAVNALRQAWRENPRDVEIGGNLGFALARAGQWSGAVEVLQATLVLDPRRSATWAPLAEAYALGGKTDEAKAAIWVSYQWSANREKSLAYYQDRVARETRAQVQALYSHIATVAQQPVAVAQ